jgi:N-acetylmuramoyl-L-alanine amidase
VCAPVHQLAPNTRSLLALALIACALPAGAQAGVVGAAAAPAPGSAHLATRAVGSAASLPLAGKVITIDPGHNGGNASHSAEINRIVNAGGGVHKACDTTGTETNDGRLPEYAFTLSMGLRLRTLLQAMGAKVVMTRTTSNGVGPCITTRAAIGNSAHSDAAISIHGDGGPASGSGFDVIEPGGVSGQPRAAVLDSHLLALRVRAALESGGAKPANYVGVKGIDRRTDLGGLNLSHVPKVLVELANMRNAGDARLLESGAARQRWAKSLAAGLETYIRTGT